MTLSTDPLLSSTTSRICSPLAGREKDQLVLNEILSGNIRGVEGKVKEHRISVCGYGPIMTLMYLSKSMDPRYRTRILARGHSGEVHPGKEVVDYISIIFYK